MEFKGQGALRHVGLQPPPPGDVARKEGDTRCVEKDGRTVRLVTIRRPGPPSRPVSLHSVAPPLQAQAHVPGMPPGEAGGRPKALGERDVKASASRSLAQAPLFGLQRAEALFTAHLQDHLEGHPLGTFTEAVHDIASFHDQGAGWMLSGGAEPPATWPPTPAFMARVFERVLDPGFTDAAQAMAYASQDLPSKLLTSVLQGLLVPGKVLTQSEQLGAVKPGDPFHDEAVRLRKQLLADQGRCALPPRVSQAVQALVAGSRQTTRQKSVDTAVVQMLATAGRRLDDASFSRLVKAVHAGMKGEVPQDEAAK